MLRIINQSVPLAVERLGYDEAQRDDIIRYMLGNGTLVEAPDVNRESLKRKGLSGEVIDQLEQAIPTTTSLKMLVTPLHVGEEYCLEKLDVTQEQVTSPAFDLLEHLGYETDEVQAADDYVFGRLTVEGAPHFKEAHLAVFDCANRCGRYGTRSISWHAHVRIMAAAQDSMAERGVGMYRWVAAARMTPQSQTIVRPSPDLAYAICRFDVADGPVLLTAPVSDTYGSLSIFDARTNNVFVASLQKDSDFNGVIVHAPGERPNDATRQALAMGGKGIALIRRRGA